MSDDYVPAEGEIVRATDLRLPRTRGLAQVLEGNALEFASFVESRRTLGKDGEVLAEIVVMDVVVERPQQPVHDIRSQERVAVVCHATDSTYPEVLALRSNFPNVPHLNHTNRETPKSLCLFEEPWPEIALRWTPFLFIEEIRSWLALTAKGLLHQDDQPLEQLLFGTGLRIVIPADLFAESGSKDSKVLIIGVASNSDECRTLIAEYGEDKPSGKPPKFVATTLVANPQAHGIIRKSPENLRELHEFLTAGGLDLISELRNRFGEWDRERVRGARLVILVAFPLVRAEGLPPEKWDCWAFITEGAIEKVGSDIGMWSVHAGKLGLLLPPDDEFRGQGAPIDAMAPYFTFNRAAAATASGLAPDTRKVAAFGAGALGSQVVTTLTRTGFGTWTIVDKDDLLPHNLARHSLSGGYVGISKALGVAFSLNQLYEDKDSAKGIVADALSPGSKAKILEEALASADLILDASASISLSRHLVHRVSSPARRVSVFMNPQGSDLVLLAEDKERNLTLDALEVQYYRATATDPRLSGHFKPNGSRLRYGRSCGDISTLIPSHLVTMHSAIASHAIREATASDGASIRIWRSDPQKLSVIPVEITPAKIERHPMGDWTLVVDQRLLDRIGRLRESKLPNETGGVLVGVRDLQHRTIYVTETIPSPPDSQEWPTLYIRGRSGLQPAVDKLSESSGNHLEYVGEWHSHPRGFPTLPSNDDLKVFVWLTEHLALAGYPAIKAIVGDEGLTRWFVAEM